MKKRNLDFLPNKLNKYSIRKFTVGTASLLIGATLVFGLDKDAMADEVSTSSSQSDSESEKTKSDSLNQSSIEATTNEDPSKEEATTEEVTNEAPSKEEETTEEVTNEAPSKEEETTEEVTNEEPSKEEETTEEVTNEAPSKEETTTEEVTNEAPSKEETTTEEVTNEAPSKEETTTEEVTNEEQSKEEATTEEVTNEEQSKEEATTEEVTNEEQSKEEATTEEVTNEEPSKEEAATEEVTNEAPSKEEAATEATTNEEPSKEETTAANISQVNDKETAATYYKEAANVTDEKAQEVIDSLDLDTENMSEQEIQLALLKELANKQNANTPLATSLRMASPQSEESINITSNELINTLAGTNNSQVIEADAIKNGYIKSQTDATNAANTLSGRAWMTDKGTPSTMSNGLTAVPEGTKVYMQWIDKDGAVSPTYSASTSNQLSKADGSQVGPGAYAFDLRDGWTDAEGKLHKYNATSGQLYRLWIEDFETENGNTATMIRQAGGFFPGRFVNSVTNSNIGQFPLIGTNMQRTGIYMGVKPSDGYMTKERSEWIHDEQGPLSSPAVSLSAKNSISGQVWLETGDGDYANSATGPNNNSKDPEAAGYTVVMSSLTTEGAKQYKEKVESLPESERAEAAKLLLEQNPEYISATVYGETDENGRYTLRFPTGTLNTSYIYGYVMDPNGDIVNGYSSYTSPQFRAPNSNLSWTPQTAPAQNLVANPMWYNVNFALVPSNDINLEILEFNNTDKPAVAGDEVKIDLTGSNLSPLPNVED